jgi:hypothetical protein
MAGKKSLPRKCLAAHCGASAASDHVFCPDHWNELPSSLREAILKAHLQERRAEVLRYVDVARDYVLQRRHLARYRGAG